MTSKVEFFNSFDSALKHLKSIKEWKVTFGKVFGNSVSGVVKHFDYDEIKKIFDQEKDDDLYIYFEGPWK